MPELWDMADLWTTTVERWRTEAEAEAMASGGQAQNQRIVRLATQLLAERRHHHFMLEFLAANMHATDSGEDGIAGWPSLPDSVKDKYTAMAARAVNEWVVERKGKM